MKLNFGKRLVLFVHWLLSLAACAMTVALIVWPECRQSAAAVMSNLNLLIYSIALLIVYLLFSVGSIAIIWSGRKRSPDHGFIVVDSSETGRTRIAVVAVEQMIRQAVRGVDGIAQMKASINNGEDSITVDVDVEILNGTHVPTVTMNIQRAIRSYIELNCGVAVRGVSVSVHSLTDAEQTGKRGRRRGGSVNVEPVASYEIPSGTAAMAVPTAPAAVEPEVPVRREPEPEPETEPVSEPESEIVPEPEVSAPIEESPAAESAPKKKGFFKGLFGKRDAEKGVEAVPEAAEAETENIGFAEEPVEEPADEETEYADAVEDGDDEGGEE